MRKVLPILTWFAVSLLVACGGPSPSESDQPLSQFETGNSATALAPEIDVEIVVPAWLVVDHDVPSNRDSGERNDGVAFQSVPDQAVVVGHVGENGYRCLTEDCIQQDRLDVYEIEPSERLIATLQMGDWAEASDSPVDLDLFVLDAEFNVVHFSVGPYAIEKIFLEPGPARFVVVFASAGVSSYQLDLTPINRVHTPLNYNDQHLFSDEVMYEFNVLAIDSRGRVDPNHFDILDSDASRVVEFDDLIARYPVDTAAWLDRLPGHWRLDGKIRPLLIARKQMAYLNRAVPHKTLLPMPAYSRTAFSDPMYALQWNHEQINTDEAYESFESLDPDSAIVAVIDSGIAGVNDRIRDRIHLQSGGYDFVSSAAAADDGDGLDNDPTQLTWDTHGTHVAATFAAKVDTVEIAGMGASVLPLRVFGIGNAAEDDVNQAIKYAAKLTNDSNTTPSVTPKSINMSLGAYAEAAQCAAVSAARTEGVSVVAAAGNDALSYIAYPALCSGAIGVSAVRYNQALASYSNYGTGVDIAAPGGDTAEDLNEDGYPDGVLSYTDGGFLDYWHGTSMATPHVAGAIALMYAANANLTPAAIDSILESGGMTTDIGDSGRDDSFGWGLLNVQEAVQSARDYVASSNLPREPALSTNHLKFGATEKSLTVEVMEKGGTAGELSIEGVYADVPNYVDVIAPGEGLDFGSYQIELKRERIATDVTQIELYFTFSDGSVRPLHLHLDAPGEREEPFTPELYRFDSASSMKPLKRQDRPGQVTPGMWALEADVTTTLFTDLDGDRDGCELGEVCAVVHGAINEHGANSLTLPDRLVDRISETPGRSVATKVWIQ